MKSKFSTKWKASRQPRKQRKYRANAPIHKKRKMISSNLSKELRKKYGKRNFPIKKGDSVKIMIGEFKEKTGKIGSVNLKKLKVMIDGIYRTKKDGTKVSVYFDPSNLQIKELNLEDSKRIKSLKRKNIAEKNKNKSEEKIIKTAIDKKNQMKQIKNYKQKKKIKFKKLSNQEDKNVFKKK